MHNFKSALIIFVISSYILSGCAAKLIPKEVVLDTETRFAEVEEYLEKKLEGKCNAPTDKLYYLCRIKWGPHQMGSALDIGHHVSYRIKWGQPLT